MSKALHLIGIAGKANVGKDFVARILQEEWGYQPFAFALHLKMNAIGMSGYSYEEVMYTKPPHVRHTLQINGTELGRAKYGENLWVNIAGGWLTYFHENWNVNRFVFADVRFENEMEFVKERGGHLIKIVSDDRHVVSKLTSEQQGHASETELDAMPNYRFDTIIKNNLDTTREQLREQLAAFIGML